MKNIFNGGNTKNTGRMLGAGLAALLLIGIAVNAFPGSARAAAAWYSPDWEFRKEIVIDHTLVAHELADFPVLVSLAEDKDLADNAMKYGEDILFTAGDGLTRLSHEIEYYENTGGQLIAWVKQPLLSAEKDTSIFMYYGNPEAADQQQAANVWDGNFSMVQHLEETIGLDYDSTLNNNDGTYNGAGQYAQGKIDGADNFNGASNNIIVPHNKTLTFTVDYTLETWVSPAQVPQWTRHMISKEGEYILQINGNFVFYVPGVGDVASATAPSLNTWTHVAAVYHAGIGGLHTLEIYINGRLENSFTGYGTAFANKKPLYLASADGLHYLNGTLDEVRISGEARSAEYLQTSYINQSKPDEFYKVGEQESPAAAPSVRTDEADPVGMTGATLRGFLTGNGGESCSVRFVWDTDESFTTPSYTPWVAGYGTGQAFSASLTDLQKATHYYYRAQAMNSAGTVSGSILYVLTRPDPPVDGSFTAVALEGGQIALTWQKGATAEKTMIRASTTGYPSSYADGRQVYFDVGESCTDSGLDPDTTYYYRAWSQITGSEQWSETFIEIACATGSGGGPVVSVGGDVHGVNKLAVLMPYLAAGLALILAAVFGGSMLLKTRRVIKD